MLKVKDKKDLPNYEEIISTLTAELENLRHQLAVKTHNQHLLKIQDKENQQQTVNKMEKKIKEITTHFQEELRLTKEIIESQNTINYLNSKLNEKQFSLYKLQTTTETTKINIPNKIKETNSQISKLSEQINAQHKILNDKKRFYMELYKKREIYETYLGVKNNNSNNNNNNSSLFYLYNRFVYEINNLNNEYLRRHKMNLVNQRNIKIKNLLEQIGIRDEYINKYNKDLLQMKIKLEYPEDKEIKNIDDIHIEKNTNIPFPGLIPLPNITNNEQQITNIKPLIKDEPKPSKKDGVIFPKSDRSKSIAKTTQDNPVIILPQVQQQPNTSVFPSAYNTNTSNFLLNNTNYQSKIDYSSYSNPNIIKKKQAFKTKTNEIIQKAKNNELSELRLNILNGMYSGSKVMYVNKNEKDNLDKSEEYVISFDAKLLNKSQSDVSIYSGISEKESTKNASSGNIFKRGTPNRMFVNGNNKISERQIDSKIKRLLGGKTRYGPYIRK